MLRHRTLLRTGTALAALVLAAFTTPVLAQTPDTVAIYTFTGAAGDEATFAVDQQPANATFTPMRRGGGVTPSVSANRFSATAWTLDSLAIDTAQYYAFRVTAAAGHQLDLDSLLFDERRSGTGISRVQVRSSLDGFSSVLFSTSVPDDTDTRTQRVGLGAAFNALTTVEFRLYGYGAEAAGGTWRIDNVSLFGAVETAGPVSPTVQFASAAQTVAESAGAVQIPVTISVPSIGGSTTVRIRLANANGTATMGTDYTFTTQTLTFTAGGPLTQNVSLTVLEDTVVEANETVRIMIDSVSGGAMIGANSLFTLTISDNDTTTAPGQTPPLETIAAVTMNDGVGVATRLNDTVRVRGIVTSPNTRTAGYSVGLQDHTGGITLFRTASIGTITLTPGDSIEVVGAIAQFNGLTEIIPDSIRLLAAGQTLPAPRVVTVIDEAAESEVVKIVGPLTIVDPAQWTNMGSGFNVDVTDGTNTYQMRILRGTDIYGTQPPTMSFSLTGVGGQFDNSSPYFEGYQIAPRFLTDFDFDSTTTMPLTVQFGSATTSVTEGATTVQIPVTISRADTAAVTVQVSLGTGSTATAGADFTFTTQTLSFAAGTTTQNATLTIVDDTQVEGNETIMLMLGAPSTGTTLGTPANLTVTIVDNDSTTGTVTPPLRTIASATINDAQGVATLLGQAVRLRGIITSPTLRTAGYQSALQDRTGGIGLFAPAMAMGPFPAMGDSVELIGVVAQFRGLTQVTIDSFRVLLPAQPLPSSRIVTVLDETTESEIVQIAGPLTLVNPAQWTNATNGFTVDVTDGTNTYSVRISPGTNVIGAAAPTMPFRLWGIGSQFSGTMAPFLNGYQLLLRSTADIDFVSGLAEAAEALVAVYPNPVANQLTITTPAAEANATIIDGLGRTVLTARLMAGTANVSVAGLPAGLYSVRVGTAVRRFVKQ